MTDYFVDERSIVRKIWGSSDTILFIFAGASAEFALNKAVDWLYFTGRLPADPLGRLFSTVSYARAIVFSERKAAFHAIDAMKAIHADVEAKRGATIPEWAYRDVLFMLIDYSIRSYEVLERKLNYEEKEEVFHVFNRVGERMGLRDLPHSVEAWVAMRQAHLERDLQHSAFTDDLFRQYKKHLGPVRYRLLREAQALVVPDTVRDLLGLPNVRFFRPLISIYKWSKKMKADLLLKALILPSEYKKEIKALDSSP